MATRKDQLQSHQFSVQRMVSALVTRESDPEQPPFRRPTTAAFGSVALAIVALAGVWVYGLVVPGGSKAWANGDAVIVEKETGTRYVYVDGHLRPVTNYASALLALGKHSDTRRVSRKSLRAVPRGPQIGIVDAPDALPSKDRLLTGAWTFCSQPAVDQAGAPTSESVLMVGRQPASGQTMVDDAMLVEVIETGDWYLITKGYRHKIEKSDAAIIGLALRSVPWARVGEAFVAALPDGQRIAPIKPAGIGQPSRAIPDRPRTLIGQLLVVKTPGGGVQYYLAGKDKPIPITELQLDIQLAYRPMKAAYGGKAPRPIEIGLLSIGQAEPPPADTDPGQAPRSRPTFVAPRDGQGTVCATFPAGGGVPSISIDPELPARDPATVTAHRGPMGTALADRVLVPPGTAAVIEVMPTDRAPAGTIAIVTDLGRAYSLANPDVLKVLGYENVTPVKIRAELASRLPQGPGLDPSAAVRSVQ
ncbi:type VII secretion protein EccB [Kribbella sindirgiensis]|uniref:Type VII secretion protein EccB n=1 Tax=Kribbella sindirgiensis TaxID=1124744 RepID=A0A4R0I230_9ACTN|nr:type VII secretion protein EccB [Kribbella sindirgiensis]TCC22337.1 type VII secretion protein EccB [Kribbella sindirgiensis]